MSAPLSVGDKVFLGNFLANISAFGVVGDLDTPDQTYFTIEGFGSNAMLTTSALIGPRGFSGSNAPLGHHQFPVYDSVDDLPTNLTDDDVDIGKYWIVRQWDENDPPNQIGSWWYMWDGTGYEQFKMGEPGQPGPVPDITPIFDLVDPSVTATSRVTVTGDSYHPDWHIEVNKELIRGPQGPDAAWDLYTGASVPGVGDVPTWNGTKYAAAPPTVTVPKFYTMPEAAFTDVPLAFGTRVPIGSFTLPALEWDVVPYVTGHVRITGLEFDADPFIIGVEVRLGEGGATGGGTLVARGFGNISTYSTIIPHSSDGGTPNDAITPDNGRAVIPAGSSGHAATIYVNAFNDGLAGIYNFSKRGAQLSVLAVPV